jgi:type IV secretion system protein TrbL
MIVQRVPWQLGRAAAANDNSSARKGVRWLMAGLVIIACAIAILCLGCGAASATETTNTIQTVTGIYKTAAQKWQAALASLAVRLFWILAAIEFTVGFFWLALRGAELGEWAGELVKQILVIGFFYALLTNSAAWAQAIVSSFQQAGEQAVAGSSTTKPFDVLNAGLQIAFKIADQSSIFSPATSVALIICALVVLICFALLTGVMVLALVESYVVISAGVLLMGFGGSSWTKDIAVKTLVYAVSVGAKLFVVQLLLGTAVQLFNQLVANFGTTNSDIFIVIGTTVVLVALTMTIPDMVQGLINGSSLGRGDALNRVVSQGIVAPAVTMATKTVPGAAMALASAGQLAGRQQTAADGEGGAAKSQAWRFAQMAGRTLGNLGRAAAGTAGDRLSGRAAFGTFGGQMSDRMDRQSGQPGSTGAQAQPASRTAGNTIRGSNDGNNGENAP